MGLGLDCHINKKVMVDVVQVVPYKNIFIKLCLVLSSTFLAVSLKGKNQRTACLGRQRTQYAL